MAHFHNNALIGAAGQGGDALYQIDRSLRFNSGDSSYLNRTPSSAGNRRTYTFSCWAKRSKLTAESNIFHANSASWFRFESTDKIYFWHNGSTAVYTDAVFRDPSAWYHLVLAVDTSQSTASNRVKIYVNGVQQTLSGTQPSQNAETGFNNNIAHYIGSQGASGSNAFNGYLTEIHSVDGQQLAASDFGEYDDNNVWQPKAFDGTHGPLLNQSQNWSSGSYSGTTPNSGYGVANAFKGSSFPGDSFGAGNQWGFFPGSATLTLPAAITLTATSTVEFYTWHNTGSTGNITVTCSNGSVAVTPVDNANIASTVVSNPYSTFGASITAITVNSSGSDWTALAGIVVDGKLLVDSNVTVPNNSFYLKFADNSSDAALGTDSSGLSNTWTVNNLSALGSGLSNATSYFDTVTWTGDGSSSRAITGLQFQPDFVWIKQRSASRAHALFDSVRGANKRLQSSTTNAETTHTDQLTAFSSNGFTVGNNNTVNVSSGTYVAWCWKAGSSNTSVSAGGLNSSIYNQSQTWSSSTYFNANGYAFYNSGGSAAQLFDNVESGPGSNGDFPLPVNGGTFTLTFSQFSSATTVELEVEGTGNALKINGSFVTIPSGSPVTATYNVSGLTTIEWLYNGGSNYCYVGSIKVDGIKLVDSGVSVTNVPSIASTTRANNSSGFSIVSYTGNSSIGQTVAHGLSTAPELIIVKNRDYSDRWGVFHTSVGGGNTLVLNSTTVPTGGTGVWGNTSPDSSVFTISNDPEANRSGSDYIAYCFAPVAGFSKFGSYTGNGSATGPVITTGFKPKFVLLRNISRAEHWIIYDSVRGNFTSYLLPNDGSAEGSFTQPVIALADGFQLGDTRDLHNRSGDTYIYAAFAGTPDGKVIDSLVDTPTNYEADSGNNGGNYCTLNPLDRQSNNGTLSNGNLDLTQSSAAWAMYRGTMFVSSGKWYYEINIGNNQYTAFGILSDDYDMASATNNWPTQTGLGDTYVLYPYTGKKLDGTQSINYTSANTSAAGDIYGVAFDLDNGTITFYKNGTSLGQAFTGISGNFAPAAWLYNQSNADSYNFGQRPFAYTPPTGHKSLCTQNLTDPTIAQGAEAFEVKLWSGNNADPRSITTSFGPDLVWIKTRNQTNWHYLTDSVRGAPNKLYTNSTNTEDTTPIYGQIDSLDSDGFTLGGGTDSSNPLSDSNQSGTNYVAWAWDAGSSNTSITAGSSNSSAYDQSQVWSTYGSPSSGGYASGLGIERGFNGDTSNQVEGNTTGAYFSIPFSTTIASGDVGYVAYSSGNSGHMKLYNGSTEVDDVTSGNGGQWKYSTYVGAITEIRISRDNRAFEFAAVSVFGKILVDSNQTPPNVPSMASTVRANPTAGFSICTYTSPNSSSNQSFGHGLNAKPDFVIIKNRDSSYNWDIYHSSLGYNSSLIFTTAATRSGAFSNEPTSSVVYTKNNYTHNGTDDYVALCWTAVEGYSAFGSYTGNGSASGPFVHTGFRPRWILFKMSSGTGDWRLMDTSRDPYNACITQLYPNNNDAEIANSSAHNVDYLSNGFRVTTSHSAMNSSGQTYVYAAFAEYPFKTARAR